MLVSVKIPGIVALNLSTPDLDMRSVQHNHLDILAFMKTTNFFNIESRVHGLVSLE